MRIHCDVCGAEIAKEEAIVEEFEGEAVCFCSAECAESRGYHQVMQDPGREEGTSPPDLR